ncbi:hypothetical protein BCV70DRAFT_200720 [Testicularia cyperi]|uniref:Uncharacterized protein n=1 Tax=Testicularia cyperi TaxID=1882483 RepID=A0A317XR87_9BASI|nr:hypothetical protein BCV70DRAFT_200720 [Testicularia cyperi]
MPYSTLIVAVALSAKPLIRPTRSNVQFNSLCLACQTHLDLHRLQTPETQNNPTVSRQRVSAASSICSSDDRRCRHQDYEPIFFVFQLESNVRSCPGQFAVGHFANACTVSPLNSCRYVLVFQVERIETVAVCFSDPAVPRGETITRITR